MTTKKKADGRYYGWVFTLNNYTDAEVEQIKALKCQYLVFGHEKGKEGTPHLQGYIYFPSARTFAATKKKFPRAHLDDAKGDSLQNQDYCTKEEGLFFEKGVRPLTQKEKGQKEKDRWIAIKKSAQEGKLDEIDPQVFVTHYRSLKQISVDYGPKPKNLDECCGEWIYGDHGTGKTTTAREKFPDAYIKQRNQWWCGYQGEDVVIMDDMDPFCKALGGQIKDWGDKWCFRAQTKGSSLFIRPKTVVITSQYHPSEIWEDKKTVDAIIDRFTVTHLVGESKRKKQKRERIFNPPPQID